MSDSSERDDQATDADEAAPDLDLGPDSPTLDLDEVPPPAAASPAGTVRRRLIGFLALVLGAVGVLASVVLAFLVLRTGFGASSAVDSLLDPVAATIERVDTRIDQADDAIDRGGVPSEGMPELRARSEGLLDVSGSAADLFTTVSDHPVYQWLPADLAPLTSALEGFTTGSSRVEEVVAATPDGDGLTSADAAIVADELDTLQAAVTDVGEAFNSAERSLRRWIRIGALFGFLASLWLCWAQFSLARRGLRAVRGRPV